jgi:23S rRNA (cytidine1920-2'-O)/16S rRNA (cytidine1409-2'-O)-methyltransferase
MRIDQLLVQRGLASTRSQAQRLIADGVEWMHLQTWKRVAKNGDEVPESAEVRLLNDAEARYVSRGGLKLEAALRHTKLAVTGFACLDVGQSTGGFTDCLLKHGAERVVGVDVGTAQLHPSLRADPRVLCVEGVNARALTPEDLVQALDDSLGEDGEFELDDESADQDGDDAGHADAEFAPEFDLIVADLSFISQTLVLPAVVHMLKASGHLLTLVKPQFELQPGQVGKGGIVRDPTMYAVVEKRLRETCAELGLTVLDWFDSPIEGGDGNREFFIYASKPDA